MKFFNDILMYFIYLLYTGVPNESQPRKIGIILKNNIYFSIQVQYKIATISENIRQKRISA